MTEHLTDSAAVEWSPRGLGTDRQPGCLVCGGEPGLYGNVSAFVASKEDGERAVACFTQGARLDFREWEPTWIQVKVGACGRHTHALEVLVGQWFISKRRVHLLVQNALSRDDLIAKGYLQPACIDGEKSLDTTSTSD